MLAVCHDDRTSEKESSEPVFDFGSSHDDLRVTPEKIAVESRDVLATTQYEMFLRQ
jgi:hypothetical protein